MPYKEELEKYIVNRLMYGNDYMAEFDIALNAILNAYENIKEHKIFNIKQKYDSTFVTESDLLVEKMIIDDIESQYGNDNLASELAYVVGITLILTVMIAKLLGGTLPILAKVCHIDPALMASPIITTIVDIVSVMIYFAIATRFLEIF